MKEKWDQRYAAEEYIYGTAPNPFFQACLDRQSPGNILLPAEGEGRNAVYAASKGWQVWAYDQSREGRKKALRLAAEKGVIIRYRISDVAKARYAAGFFDAIALLYIHLPEQIREYVHRRTIRYLCPGGILVLEGFSKEQISCNSGGPKDPSMLYSLKDLRDDFRSLEVIMLEKKLVTLDAGSMHQGEASIVRLIARKPAER